MNKRETAELERLVDTLTYIIGHKSSILDGLSEISIKMKKIDGGRTRQISISTLFAEGE